MLGLAPSTVRWLTQTGHLPFVRFYGRLAIPRIQVAEYARLRAAKPALRKAAAA